MAPGRSFLRDNVFLVAAVALPLVVVVFFVASMAIPRWLVAPPAYDLVLKATDNYNQVNLRVAVDFAVRDGRVEATVRPIEAGGWGMRSKLFLFDHGAMSVREIPVDLPNLDKLKAEDPSQTFFVEALAGRQVLTQTKAPDGYEFTSRTENASGIVGDIFGMHRYGAETSLVNNGRVIPITLPAPFQSYYFSPVYALGWIVPAATEERR